MSLPRITIPRISQADTDSLSTLCPSLSFTERLVGFGACMLMGALITLSSFGSFSELILGKPLRFAVFYSMGNLTALCSTLFLVGPKRQYRNMTNPTRKISAAIYLSCLLLTLLTAVIAPELAWLIIALVATQWASLFWYSLSYIPFGRRMASSLANRLL